MAPAVAEKGYEQYGNMCNVKFSYKFHLKQENTSATIKLL